MNRWTVLLAAMLITAFAVLGCSGGNTPVVPNQGGNDLTSGIQSVAGNSSNTYLWAYYDVTIDTATKTITAVPDRTTQFAANVVTFLNGNPAAMSFDMKNLEVLADKVIVDIDVTLAHPFTGMPQFNGYDVRGVFMGDSSATMKYSSKLKYPEYGDDQYQLDDPVNDDGGGPDGYTRWFNAAEFPVSGLVGYTPGNFGSKNFDPTATVNPYKYFADGIAVEDDAFDFLMANAADKGVFASGSENTRNYYLEFPLPTPGAKYGYAVVANWEAPDVHPSNAPEAPAAKVTITPDIYYVDGTDKGGDIILDIDVWSWKDQPSLIKVESSVLTAVYPFTLGDMTPIGGGDNYSTYHVEIPANNITHNSEDGGDGDLWVICEYDGETYTSSVTPPGGAPIATLAAFFRYPLYISDVAYNKPPEITSGVDGNAAPLEMATEQYSVTATDPDGDPLTYSWTLTDVASGDPVAGYDGVAGNGDGTIDINYGAWPYPWALAGTEFELDCSVSDGVWPPVDATTLEIKVDVDGDLWVSNHADFAAVPDNGTKTEPYSTVNQAIAALPANPGATIVIDYGAGEYQITSYLNLADATYSNATLRGYSWYADPGGRPVIKAYCSTYLLRIYNATNVTVQGLKFEANPSYSVSYLMYVTNANNSIIRDCTFTGLTASSSMTGTDIWQSLGISIYNNKYYDLGPSTSYTTTYVYACRITNSVYPNTRTVSYNEFTNIFPSSVNYYYTQLQVIGLRTPGGVHDCINNLIHHIKPSYNSGYAEQVGYAFYNSTGNSGTYNFTNNTVDNLDFTNSAAIGYSLYAYFNSYTGQSPVAKNNIVSNYIGNAAQYMYGFYHNYNGVNGVTYCDAYNVTYPWAGFTNMTGNITADPEYENNTTPPYDYHLKSTSPCKGSGSGGADMGCYGNMGTGQTIIGIVTPQ
jgi:hypothetical protein